MIFFQSANYKVKWHLLEDMLQIKGLKSEAESAFKEVEKLVHSIEITLFEKKVEFEIHEVHLVEEVLPNLQKEFRVEGENLSITKVKLEYCCSFKGHEGGEKMVEVHIGDIAEQVGVDCIVNPANEQLNNAGGVAGRISGCAGTIFEEECREWIKKHGKLETGSACSVSAGRLPFKCVINTVGPIKGINNDKQILRKSCLSALKEAEKLKLNSLCMPVISSGIFGFDFSEASKIITSAIVEFLKNGANSLVTVRVCSNKPSETEIVCQSFASLIGPSNTSRDLIKKKVAPVQIAEGKYIWEWMDDDKSWKPYEGLHNAITAKFESKSAFFDSKIDNMKYQQGQGYRIFFDKLVQKNVQTGFKRKVRRRDNPAHSPNPIPPVGLIGKEVKPSDLCCIKLRGVKEDVDKCESELRKKIKEGILSKQLNTKAPFTLVTSICTPLCVKVVEDKEGSLKLIGRSFISFFF